MSLTCGAPAHDRRSPVERAAPGVRRAPDQVHSLPPARALFRGAAVDCLVEVVRPGQRTDGSRSATCSLASMTDTGHLDGCQFVANCGHAWAPFPDALLQ